jgi:hypothetical protein
LKARDPKIERTQGHAIRALVLLYQWNGMDASPQRAHFLSAATFRNFLIRALLIASSASLN